MPKSHQMILEVIPLTDINPAPYNPHVSYRVHKNCLICGKQFLAKKDCKTRTQIYCSKECYAKSLIGKKATGKQLASLELGRSGGHPSSLKGVPRSKETREKISQTRKGKPLSISHRQALSEVKKGKPITHFVENREEINHKLSKALKGKPQPNLRGEKHWNWQNGKTIENAQVRNSLEMTRWRRSVFERDNFTCQICRERGGRLVADHIKPFSLYPKLRLELSNGRTLCKDCDISFSGTYGGKAVQVLCR